MNRRKPILGEKLIARCYYFGGRHRDTGIIVSKVGRIYWEAETEDAEGRRRFYGKFTIGRWTWADFNAQANAPVFIAESMQQLLDHEESRQIRAELFSAVHNNWNLFESFDLETLRQLKSILVKP